MFSWLKNHFIPHTGNNHRPHILRTSSIRSILILVIFLEIFTFIIPTLTHLNSRDGMAAVLPAVLASLTNEERQAQNLNTLDINPILNKAAEMKATDMATKGYFAHTSPEGKTPWYWLEQVGYDYQYAGENLAINFTDSKDVTVAWMASPTHRANIVKGNYTEVGTGIATGLYEGKETVFVAQVYANPLKKESEKIQVQSEIPKKIAEVDTLPIPDKANVLGAEVVKETSNAIQPQAISTTDTMTPIKAQVAPSIWQKAFASPRNTMNTVLYVVFIFIFLSLILNISIKIRHHHIDLITNGLLVIALLGVFLVVNYYMSYKDMVTIQSVDYSHDNK